MAYLASLIILATQAFVIILPNPVAVPAPFPGGKHFYEDILFLFNNQSVDWVFLILPDRVLCSGSLFFSSLIK